MYPGEDDVRMLIGIIGKTNVGKSTLFSALTLVPVKVENRPFTTIEPNIGVAYVKVPCPCREFNVKDNPKNSICINGFRYIPVKLIDVAGLVPGAHEGRGLGNKFLDELRRADALIHVVDASGSTDAEGRPCPPGSHDPCLDVEIIEQEMIHWFTEVVHRNWSRVVKAYDPSRGLIEAIVNVVAGLSVSKTHVAKALMELGLNEEHPRRWGEELIKELATKLFRLSKPMIIAANKADLPSSVENIKRLKERFESRGIPVIPCSAEAELALRRAASKGLIDYEPGTGQLRIVDEAKFSEAQLKAIDIIKNRVLNIWGSTGVQELINQVCFKLLRLMVVYPVEDPNRLCDHKGNVLPDALLVPEGTTARQLAYMIHSDLGDSFIYAIDARTKRRLGEEAVLKDGDVISIVAAKAK